jgi:hypothetical protein
MNREVHVRICERLGVKFPGPTRQKRPHRCGLLVRFFHALTLALPNRGDRSAKGVAASRALGESLARDPLVLNANA